MPLQAIMLFLKKKMVLDWNWRETALDLMSVAITPSIFDFFVFTLTINFNSYEIIYRQKS